MAQTAVVVLPTYNEKENIAYMLEALLIQAQKITSYSLSVLVVDDSSPDGTADIVQQYAEKYPAIKLLKGEKKGLGEAYIRGFRYAIQKMKADVVFEMDADFSHNPKDIPRFLAEIDKGNEFVIGSRYIKGGSIPRNWSLLRRLNSSFGNLFARHIAGVSEVRDCTSGFRAIKTSLLRTIRLNKLHVRGYAFQMNLLYEALFHHAAVKEIPIHFVDREHGNSKLKMRDIIEFIYNAFALRFPFLRSITPSDIYFPLAFFIILEFFILTFFGVITLPNPVVQFIGILTGILTIQSIYNIYWMIYAWEDSERAERNALPNTFSTPQYSFTAIIPARQEESVIAHTIEAVSSIDYPEELKETLIVCRSDDIKTIKKVNETIAKLGKKNVRQIVFNDLPINKPHALNIALQESTKDIVTIFDAEDEPHSEIYHIINTTMKKEKVDVIQAGVQLMNYNSTWFSTLNVLEYFFWFKSTLHYFAKNGIIPLGGNTVFFKRDKLIKVGGWDENCLTEDADIGIRLSAAGAKFKVVYSGTHATQEETPHDVRSFIKQRTRWNQGFIQVLAKGEWKKLPKLSQRLLALYVLLLPEFQALLFLIFPVSIILSIIFKISAVFALFTLLPLLLLLLQLIIYNIGLYEFTREYKQKFPLWIPLKIFITFIPFQLLLGMSAFRGIIRIITGNTKWEKTAHLNAHRSFSDVKSALSA